MSKADIGLIGLAVMGQNLVLNMEDHGFTVAVYNRTVSRVDEFINGGAKGRKIIGTHSIEELTGVEKFNLVRSNEYRKIYIDGLGVQERIFQTITSCIDKLKVYQISRPNVPIQIKQLADFIESKTSI